MYPEYKEQNIVSKSDKKKMEKLVYTVPDSVV